jgi:hypothetical protein
MRAHRKRRTIETAAAARLQRAARKLAAMLRTAIALLCCGLVAAAPAAAQTDVAADIRMAEDARPMRAAADRFIASAAAGDVRVATAMLSRALVERSGEDAVAQAMRTQIVPFFARGGEVGRSTTVARTTDAAGQQGFAFYLWWVPNGGEARPFTVYVVDERGTPRIANVVPDRMVAGRHR